jgi:UDP-GlcNAc:undecaprenyl-phosphate/decaprenyl-phosphate GlcNAc-1-phosphate transferase
MELIRNIPLLYILMFSATLIFSALINNIFLKFAKTLGIRRNEGVQIRWSPTAKPALGGISFFVIFLITFICLELILSETKTYLSDGKLLGVLATITIAFIMGLADDAFDTKPLLKFLTQFSCAIILVLTGTRIHCFNSEFLNYTLTIFWVVGLMNSINMLDNMDAITTLVSMVILSFILSINIINNTALSPIPFLSLGVLGALAGFLIYNWHPAKMFMGDTGSQFLGVFLAILGIDHCWNISPAPDVQFPVNYESKSILAAGLVFLIPLCDTTTVVINRISRGQSPFVGGKDHTTHHLFFKGITEKRIAVLFTVLSSVACFLAYQIMIDREWTMLKFALYSIYPLVVFGFLFGITHYKVKK